MNPTRQKYYRSLFALAAVYDVLVGITFLFFRGPAYEALGIREKLPAFGGYLGLLGAFVLVIGVAYFLIARGDLRRNVDLILIGALYKLAYCATAFYYWLAGDIPHVIFVGLFGVADAICFLLMAECYWFLKKEVKG